MDESILAYGLLYGFAAVAAVLTAWSFAAIWQLHRKGKIDLWPLGRED